MPVHTIPTEHHEGYVPVTNAALYWREIGQGQSIVTLHGGPDFDQSYLLPDMDRLSGLFRLIYYDQRGRGKSGRGVQPEDVSIQSEVEDLECVRAFFRLESMAILGHSWGSLLAMEYAIRHPHRVSHLILMNTAPASHEDLLLFQEDRMEKAAADLAKLKAIRLTDSYKTGDINTDAEYYRIHFRATVLRPQHLETIISHLRLSLTPEGIRKSRAIEDRLYSETWHLAGYDLLPYLRGLSIPTLVIHGEHDFVPLACAAHIAEAIPGARLADLRRCGHFTYLECPDQVRTEIVAFFGSTRKGTRDSRVAKQLNGADPASCGKTGS